MRNEKEFSCEERVMRFNLKRMGRVREWRKVGGEWEKMVESGRDWGSGGKCGRVEESVESGGEWGKVGESGREWEKVGESGGG